MTHYKFSVKVKKLDWTILFIVLDSVSENEPLFYVSFKRDLYIVVLADCNSLCLDLERILVSTVDWHGRNVPLVNCNKQIAS